MRNEHLLVMRFSAMGDVAMLVPVVHSLAMQYPDLRITVLSRRFAKAFFDGLAPNVGFMEADLGKEYKGLRGLNALYRRLKAKHFTAIADMHDVLRTQYLRTRFSLDRYKVAHINKHRAGKKRLLSTTHRQLVQQPTAFENYADVLTRLGYLVELKFQSIFPSQGGNLRQVSIAELREKKSFHKWIGIAPFAAHDTKEYPLEKMEAVVASLCHQYANARILLFGAGRRERECFKQWCEKYPKCLAVSTQAASLFEELVVMSHLDVMVSMDSANTHLASIVDVPVVGVWGSTHPFAGFMGWGQHPDTQVQLDNMPCRPCSVYGNKMCRRGDLACLTGISPEEVLGKVELVLNHKCKHS
ncbi:MAG: glycosyltransferase family 9 protein [Prevotella sp.]|nr:glycosyltransferase family 9 protein [Prevotella sp.]